MLFSPIEGTHVRVEEVLRFEADANEPFRESDIKEILNYRRAIIHVAKGSEERPFFLSMLKELQSIGRWRRMPEGLNIIL